jgi:2-polyprenyl-6-methoxyphenol hydroxylase-like FAD-dependent oxidoreductase
VCIEGAGISGLTAAEAIRRYYRIGLPIEIVEPGTTRRRS